MPWWRGGPCLCKRGSGPPPQSPVPVKSEACAAPCNLAILEKPISCLAGLMILA